MFILDLALANEYSYWHYFFSQETAVSWYLAILSDIFFVFHSVLLLNSYENFEQKIFI